MELALAKMCHNAVVHLTLPDTNLIHNIIQEYKNNLPTKHLSSLHKLLNLFHLTEQRIEQIKPTPHLSQAKLCPTTIIDKSRDKSIQKEASDDSDFKLYSNGSCQNGR